MLKRIGRAVRGAAREGLVRMTGSAAAQQLLERGQRASAYLMGIGAGGETQSSGERRVLELIRKRGQPPYHIFDVGANQGQYARLVLAELGPGNVELHCFEPAVASFELLQQAVPAGAHITLNRTALGREAGELTLFSDAAGSQLASLTQRRLDHRGIAFERTEQVAVLTIDDYCAGKGIDRIDLLKIDVEGHELDVLAGAANTIARGAIDAVVFEFGGCNIDTRTFLRDFFHLFRAAGMSLYRIAPSGYLRPLTHYQEAVEQFQTSNYLALRTVDGLTRSS